MSDETLSQTLEGGHGDAPAYTLDALDTVARHRFEAHVASCAECRQEVDDLAPVAGRLALAVPQVDPPPHLGPQLLRRAQAVLPAAQRVPATAGAPPVAGSAPGLVALGASAPAAAIDPRRRWWRWGERASPFIAAASLVVALTAGSYAFVQRQETQRTAESAARLAETLSIMYQPGRVARQLWGTEASPQAKGMVYLVPDGVEAIVVTYNLPRLAGNESYQFWLNNVEEEKRVSGGVFRVDERGHGQLIVRAPEAFNRFRTVGVSKEPAPRGSRWPTGPRVLSGSI